MHKYLPLDYDLVEKYNLPVPRYTSYPTVPLWKENFEASDWKQHCSLQFKSENKLRGISLYIHLPFCESLCTYCGCNKKITTNHTVEEEYLNALAREWKLYKEMFGEKPVIRELHLGGGTPTFFSAQNLDKLLGFILDGCHLHPLHEFSIEGHPNNTTPEHLITLHKRGFTRISLGVQDNDPEVQRIINRVQPFENVKNVTAQARQAGFSSVNFDLIYGLPLQTEQSIEKTIQQVVQLRPDRIAFYSYAHVPWTSKGQRLFDERDLPSGKSKIALYIKGKEILLENGYADIGMDHFALKTDELYKAWHQGRLHRNFMGYTTQHSGMLIGLGVSAISDAGDCYTQNDKTLSGYYEKLLNNELPVKKGIILTHEDVLFKRNILDISCKGSTLFEPDQMEKIKKYSIKVLEELAEDGLIEYNEVGCKLTHNGHYFIRNVCSAFDLHLQRHAIGENNTFSKAI